MHPAPQAGVQNWKVMRTFRNGPVIWFKSGKVSKESLSDIWPIPGQYPLKKSIFEQIGPENAHRVPPREDSKSKNLFNDQEGSYNMHKVSKQVFKWHFWPISEQYYSKNVDFRLNWPLKCTLYVPPGRDPKLKSDENNQKGSCITIKVSKQCLNDIWGQF